MAKSWRTTLAGVLTLIGVLATQAGAYFDDDPTTAIDWKIVAPALTAAAGLLFSRDNNVTSEQAGANK